MSDKVAQKEANQTKLIETCPSCGKPLLSDPNRCEGSSGDQPQACSCATSQGEGLSVMSSQLEPPKPRAPMRSLKLKAGSQLPLPHVADHLDVLELLGQGGMGAVYRVLDRNQNKEFAIKLLSQELAADPAKCKRFQEEVSATSDLTHANIVSVYGLGTSIDGRPYMIMEFVPGKTLAELLEEDVFLEPARAMEIFIQICDAMAYAHSRAVIHLDLKPGNVLVTKCGDVETVKIVDFGIARVTAAESGHAVAPEDVVGSLLYMSPEQCRGDILDSRSDIYSLGCMMYEVLTGRPAFTAENPIKTIVKHLQEKPPELRGFNRLDIPIALNTIVLHALEKTSKYRYQFMEEIAKDLELAKEGRPPLVAQRHSMERGQSRQLKPWQRAVIGLTTALVAVLYLVHLGSYDTLEAFGRLCSSLFLLVVLAAAATFAYYSALQAQTVSLRLKEASTTLPGDKWLRAMKAILLLIFSEFSAWLVVRIFVLNEFYLPGCKQALLSLNDLLNLDMRWLTLFAVAHVAALMVSFVLWNRAQVRASRSAAGTGSPQPPPI